jgi:cyclopropane fatty-acyl-phospholipid synthase-like methyltransferase
MSKQANTPGMLWDKRYAEDDYVFGHEPNQWMAENTDLLTPGLSALVPGDGEGRNGVWLAERGLIVTTIDASPVGVEKAQKLAASRNVKLEMLIGDLKDWEPPALKFNVLVSAFLHVNSNDRRTLHRKLAATLNPGGLMLLEGFAPGHLDYGSGGPSMKERMFTEAGLREDFADMLDIEHLREAKVALPTSERHSGPAVVMRLRARRKKS